MDLLHYRFVSLLVAVLLLGTAISATGSAQEGTPGAGDVTILAPDESYAGVTRGEWDARQWQWAVSFPPDISPGVNVTGDGCGYGQSGPIYFVPGNFSPDPVEMTCVVPEGTAIYVPLGSSECSTVEPPPFFGRDEDELRTCAEATADEIPISDLTVSINGRDVEDLDTYRTTSPAFSLAFPENNVFGVPAGVARSVANGYSFIIAPPARGTYEIVFTNSPDNEEPFINTYQVIVEAPQVSEPAATPGATPTGATPDA